MTPSVTVITVKLDPFGISEMPEPRCEEQSVVGGFRRAARQLDLRCLDAEFVQRDLCGALAGD